MNVNFHGFRLEAGDGFSLADLATILLKASSETKEYDFNNHKRLLLFDGNSNEDFYTGLIITTKDQRSFCELQRDGGKFKIKVSALEEGSQLMDFNFFVLHKKTFCGIYQHYFASCSTLQFCIFLREFFWKPERDIRIAAATKDLVKAKKMRAETAEKVAKRQFKKPLGFDLFYKPDDYDKIMLEMDEIKGFQYEVATKLVKDDALLPQGVELKRVQRRVIFENKSLVKQITKSVVALVKGSKIERGRIVAVDPYGDDRMIDINRNIEGFGEFDFDDVTAEIELDVENFADSWVTKRLIEAALEDEALFCMQDA